MMVLFELGRLVSTPGALEVLKNAGSSGLDLLERHRNGDWGDLCEEDHQQNRVALREGLRLFSSYDMGPDAGRQTLWIITEADRSVTTILKPEEY